MIHVVSLNFLMAEATSADGEETDVGETEYHSAQKRKTG